MKLITIIMLILSMFPNGNTEYMRGTVTERLDGYSTLVIVDTNGDEWIVEDSTAPVGVDCIIQFDTNGNEDIYDDEITGIIYFQNFN